MPQFSRDVPTDPRGASFQIVRTPTGPGITAIVTSPDLLGCFTHYWKGRTMPCEGQGCTSCANGQEPVRNATGKLVHKVGKLEIECDGPPCEACLAGMPYRWHAYQSVLVLKTHAHMLFECTAQAAENFTEYRDAHGTIRGCLFEAKRMHSTPNGRIILRCRPADLTGTTLPKPPDLVKVLGILWSFNSNDVHVGPLNPEKKTQKVTHTPKAP